MTIGKLFFWTILLTICLAAVILGVTHYNEQFYKQLEADLLPKLENAHILNVTVAGKTDSVENNISSMIDSTRTYKVVVSDTSGSIREFHYYILRTLRVVDRLGDHGRPSKRTLQDIKGRIRIVIFYNDRGEEVLKEYRDEDGKIVKRWRNDFLPVSGRTGY